MFAYSKKYGPCAQYHEPCIHLLLPQRSGLDVSISQRRTHRMDQKRFNKNSGVREQRQRKALYWSRTRQVPKNRRYLLYFATNNLNMQPWKLLKRSFYKKKWNTFAIKKGRVTHVIELFLTKSRRFWSKNTVSNSDGCPAPQGGGVPRPAPHCGEGEVPRPVP